MAAVKAPKSVRLLFEFGLAAACGWLLVLAFPKQNFGFLAWACLAPLLLVLSRRGPWTGFFLFYACGLVFFLGHFRWILEIKGYTILHHLLLDLYLGFYFAVFGGLIGLVVYRFGVVAGMAAAPFLWVALEFIRSNFFFLELPWGLMAHSQYCYPSVIQTASIAGVYGVSFLVVLANAALACLVSTIMGARLRPHDFIGDPRSTVMFMVAAAIFISTAIGYGINKKNAGTTENGNRIRLALIQGSIPQDQKWEKGYADTIMDIFADLTRRAAEERPDLIIWPETATPGAINLDRTVAAKLGSLMREIRIPLLLGSSQQRKFETETARELKYHNSVFLLQPNPGRHKNVRYDKIRLFPFGEYLPYKHIIPWSAIGVPDVGGYVPGDQYTVFEQRDWRFSATICWENLFPDQVRQFVRKGAQFIVNITNEAWFGETEAPEQFLSMNVFRAVENGIFLVRCANTGISCIIDPCGRVLDRVKDENGKDVFVRGYVTGEIIPLQSNSLYTRYGDWFAWLCVIVSAGIPPLALLKMPSSAR